MQNIKYNMEIEGLIDSAMKGARRAAKQSLAILKEREARQDLVHIRKDDKTILVMPRDKAIKRGYLKGEAGISRS